ncbi:MAG TPA: hypothetical protein VFS52_03645 [Steroidobacteraceae bacterium]|jgi:hypothetical protein|nr:hypothetical protein [Steroidobacteraceae bacterium]
MSNNLFVAFDARDPVREPSLVLAAIEELGQAVRLFSTFWYVRSRFTAAEAARRLWDIMQPEDALVVVDASSEEVAALNVDDASIEWMQKRWRLGLETPAHARAFEFSRTAERTEPSKLSAPRCPVPRLFGASTP